MEDRRCRKVMAIALATVIILSVSVQNVYAAPRNSADNMFYRIWGFKLSMLGNVGSDVREIVLNGVNELKSICVFLDKKISEEKLEADSENNITVVIEQIPLPHAQEIIVKNEEVAEAHKDTHTDAEVKTVSFSRGGVLFQEDVELLARIIHAEARGESFEGQVAVGAVVLNRVESPKFPMSIREVVYQPRQFTAVDDGQMRLTPNQTAFRAAMAALEGHDPSNGAIFYYNPRIATDQWIRTRAVMLTIGNHDFCI